MASSSSIVLNLSDFCKFCNSSIKIEELKFKDEIIKVCLICKVEKLQLCRHRVKNLHYAYKIIDFKHIHTDKISKSCINCRNKENNRYPKMSYLKTLEYNKLHNLVKFCKTHDKYLPTELFVRYNNNNLCDECYDIIQEKHKKNFEKMNNNNYLVKFCKVHNKYLFSSLFTKYNNICDKCYNTLQVERKQNFVNTINNNNCFIRFCKKHNKYLLSTLFTKYNDICDECFNNQTSNMSVQNQNLLKQDTDNCVIQKPLLKYKTTTNKFDNIQNFDKFKIIEVEYVQLRDE